MNVPTTVTRKARSVSMYNDNVDYHFKISRKYIAWSRGALPTARPSGE